MANPDPDSPVPSSPDPDSIGTSRPNENAQGDSIESAPLFPTISFPGGALVWIVIAIELVTFFAFFIMYARGYSEQPELFREGQQHLSVLSGTINTVVLLIGSWLIARGAAAAIQGQSRQWGWMAATATVGVLFVAIKLKEYGHAFGVADSDNMFWFYYLFLTVFHLLHVLVGIALSAAMAWRQRPASESPPELESVEATAMFWHLVDLVWIILFPLLYIVEVSS